MKIPHKLAPESRRQTTALQMLKLLTGIEAAIEAGDKRARRMPATARDVAKNERVLSHLIVSLSVLTGRDPLEIRQTLQEHA